MLCFAKATKPTLSSHTTNVLIFRQPNPRVDLKSLLTPENTFFFWNPPSVCHIPQTEFRTRRTSTASDWVRGSWPVCLVIFIPIYTKQTPLMSGLFNEIRWRFSSFPGRHPPLLCTSLEGGITWDWVSCLQWYLLLLFLFSRLLNLRGWVGSYPHAMAIACSLDHEKH